MIPPRALIAVVDDEEAIRRALSRLITNAGYDVACYEDGEHFLSRELTRRTDCVVLDLHMPGIGGLQVLSRLGATKDSPPVIVVTGQDDDQVRARALARGTSAYLRKPVDEHVLLDAIAVALSPASGRNRE